MKIRLLVLVVGSLLSALSGGCGKNGDHIPRPPTHNDIPNHNDGHDNVPNPNDNDY